VDRAEDAAEIEMVHAGPGDNGVVAAAGLYRIEATPDRVTTPPRAAL
jgi:hypothetical protein